MAKHKTLTNPIIPASASGRLSEVCLLPTVRAKTMMGRAASLRPVLPSERRFPYDGYALLAERTLIHAMRDAEPYRTHVGAFFLRPTLPRITAEILHWQYDALLFLSGHLDREALEFWCALCHQPVAAILRHYVPLLAKFTRKHPEFAQKEAA